jgi:hypothetical protein
MSMTTVRRAGLGSIASSVVARAAAPRYLTEFVPFV